jgi:hypothetical protein
MKLRVSTTTTGMQDVIPELITLSIGNQNVLELLHACGSTRIHQAESSRVIGPLELVICCESKIIRREVKLGLKRMRGRRKKHPRAHKPSQTCGRSDHRCAEPCMYQEEECRRSRTALRTRTCSWPWCDKVPSKLGPLLLRLKPHVLVLAFSRLESLVPLLGVYA